MEKKAGAQESTIKSRSENGKLLNVNELVCMMKMLFVAHDINM